MKLSKLVILLLIAFLLAYSGTMIYYYIKNGPVDIQEKDIDVQVKLGAIGFNVNTSAFYFGTISPKNYGIRYFNIKNTRSFDQTVSVRFKGDVSSWMKTEETDFNLKQGEEKNVELRLYVPENATYGNYTGKAVFIFKRT